MELSVHEHFIMEIGGWLARRTAHLSDADFSAIVRVPGRHGGRRPHGEMATDLSDLGPSGGGARPEGDYVRCRRLAFW